MKAEAGDPLASIAIMTVPEIEEIPPLFGSSWFFTVRKYFY
jgi:hypothetical protein